MCTESTTSSNSCLKNTCQYFEIVDQPLYDPQYCPDPITRLPSDYRPQWTDLDE